jgi:hypothetical protein
LRTTKTFRSSGRCLNALQQGSDLWTVPVERLSGAMRLGRPQPLLQQAGTKGATAISPDNRWLAYTSSESGRFEIYVMPFSPRGTAANRKWVVSNGGELVPPGLTVAASCFIRVSTAKFGLLLTE